MVRAGHGLGGLDSGWAKRQPRRGACKKRLRSLIIEILLRTECVLQDNDSEVQSPRLLHWSKAWPAHTLLTLVLYVCAGALNAFYCRPHASP